MHRQETIKKAIQFRKDGHSYNHISKEMGLAKSTLYEWLSDVPYTPNQETIDRIGKARAASGARKAKIKIDSMERSMKMAEKEIVSLSKRDIMMLGLALYIGEGGKSFEIVRVINADVRVIKLFIKWFETVFGCRRDNFFLTIYLYPDNNLDDCLRFWSRETGIPLKHFGKTQIDRREGKKIAKRGKLPYGTAHLSVRSRGNKELGVDLFRKIQSLMTRVFELSLRA